VTPFFEDLLESIGLRKRKDARVGLRPHRDLTLAVNVDAAHRRVLDAFVTALGANVDVDDRTAHTLEAGFGTVNSERIRVTLERVSADHTRVRIEAHYRAGVARPSRSPAVDALADAIEAGVGD